MAAVRHRTSRGPGSAARLCARLGCVLGWFLEGCGARQRAPHHCDSRHEREAHGAPHARDRELRRQSCTATATSTEVLHTALALGSNVGLVDRTHLSQRQPRVCAAAFQDARPSPHEGHGARLPAGDLRGAGMQRSRQRQQLQTDRTGDW